MLDYNTHSLILIFFKKLPKKFFLKKVLKNLELSFLFCIFVFMNDNKKINILFYTLMGLILTEIAAFSIGIVQMLQ